MQKNIIIVIDCGATNVRAVAVCDTGEIVAMHSVPNRTQPDPYFPKGLIWNTDTIWEKLIQCTRNIVNQILPENIRALTITTFGVNGAPVDTEGELLYPVISWQCQRTVPVMEKIGKYISLDSLYKISGVNQYHFNTINTLVWLKENKPEVLDNMHAFLFIASLFVHRLTGNMINDTTMAGTSMLTDINKRKFSAEILDAIGISDKFSKLADPGTIAGSLLRDPASELGIPAGIPVVLTGHDTQFALIGSGAGENEAILNSGTWEILMTRTRNINLSKSMQHAGVTNELDAIPGIYNTGIQWLASGILEWIRNNFYTWEMENDPQSVYNVMIREATEIHAEYGKIEFDPAFAMNLGSISGLGLNTSRGEIYQAALVSLSEKTNKSLETLQKTGQFKADSLIVSGGGSKNHLWNRIRANTMGIPLRLVKESETTVLGAAVFTFHAIGQFNSIEEGIKAFSIQYDWIYPD